MSEPGTLGAWWWSVIRFLRARVEVLCRRTWSVSEWWREAARAAVTFGSKADRPLRSLVTVPPQIDIKGILDRGKKRKKVLKEKTA